MANRYDIFISYRRDGGAQYARIIQLMLIQRGYKVFLDYDELTDGVFSDKIQKAIREAPVFMLVLSKGSMQRCANEGDWVRREITLAVEQHKHIIPINPDNSFDGFPKEMPENLRNAIGSLQYSEISFGQALGATIDLMIANRLIPNLGKRNSKNKIDSDYDAANESLRKADAHRKFIKKLTIICAIVIIAIISVTCYWIINNQKNKDSAEQLKAQLSALRSEVEQRHSRFGLILSDSLSERQINAIDTMLINMTELYPDSIWISQFEFTEGLWNRINNEPSERSNENLPKTNVSFGEIYMFLSTLADFTNLQIELPGAEVWEYAAKGGSDNENTIYSGSNNAEKVAWFKENSGGKAHPSDGQQGMEPNLLDLYDMSGNVAELCNSASSNGLYTACGGNYNSDIKDITVSSRQPVSTDAKLPTLGFRIIIIKSQN